jgi:integrase/recombinase XerD
MSGLRAHLANYVTLRRSLGFVVKEADCLLPSFVEFLETSGADHVTTELALTWATSHPQVLPVTKRQRLMAVRGFAEYLNSFDARTEIPPPDLLPATYSRVTPHIYTDGEIDALMAAATTLSPPIRAWTYQTLIGLLAVSGIRIGEAIRLDDRDIDNSRSLLVVRNSKLEKAREVPLHSSTLVALATYETERDRHFPQRPNDSLFVSTLGTRLHPCTVRHTYWHLIALAGVHGRGGRSRPRVHDIRHSFAVKTLAGWYRDGVDIDASMPLLSKMLGHANPASTYWYLSGTPELFTNVADRIGHLFEELP